MAGLRWQHAILVLGVGASACGVGPAGSTGAEQVDAELVAGCVELVQFQAYVGDDEGGDIWQRSGQTSEGLETECRSIGVADPARLRQMSDQLEQLDAYVENGGSTAEASARPAGDCHPSYGGCVPIASDVDCEGNGDGPEYLVLSVLVYGPDEYELDRDGDGMACEPGGG